MAQANGAEGSAKGLEHKICLVTGGSGKLGNALIKVLIKNNSTVRALVKDKADILNLPGGVVPYVGDINDRNVIREAVTGCDDVFHLAGIVSAYKQKSSEIINVNVNGVRNVLEACEVHGVKHVIFPSSVDAYGIRRKEVLTEDSPLRPNDPYGYSKMLAEAVVNEFSRSVPTTVFRVATIYGKNFEGPFFKIFKAIKEGKAYIIGNGKNHLALVHLYDVLQAFMLAAESSTGAGRVYNLSDGVPYTQEGLFDIAADMLHVEKPNKRISMVILAKILGKYKGLDSDELRFILSDRQVDISRIRKELGFNPIVDINVGGRELVDEFLSMSVK